MDISEKIKKLRKDKGFSQKELAKEAGLSIASIQGYEQGKYKPKLETVQKLARALGVLVYDLQTPSDSPEIWAEDGLGLMRYAEKIALEIGRNPEEVLIDMMSPSDDHWKSNEYQMEEFLDSMDMLGAQLNKLGKDKALELTELITKIPEYQKDPEPPQD